MNRYSFSSQSQMQSYHVLLDPDQFASMLKEGGWSESAIEKELALLQEYKQRFKLEEPKELDIEEAALSDKLMAAVDRRRKKRESRGSD